MHIEPTDPAVSHRVVQGFLEDPEQAERRVVRYIPGNLLGAKHDLDLFLPRDLPTETPHCGHNAQKQQPWRVQLVRHRLHIGDDLRGLLLKRVQTAEDFARRIRLQSFQLPQPHRQQCEALTDVVVQVSGDPGTLRLLGFKETATHAGQHLFGTLALRDVLDGAAESCDAAAVIALGLSACPDPSVRAVRANHFQIEFVGCAGVEGRFDDTAEPIPTLPCIEL